MKHTRGKMKHTRGKMKHTIGLINGGGTGPEIIRSAKEVIRNMDSLSGFDLKEFDNDRYKEVINIERWNEGLYQALMSFYDELQGGIILRGSLPAPILYKIRTDMRFDTKLVPLNPYPKYSIAPDFDVLLVRENAHGIYHCDDTQRSEHLVEGRFHYDKCGLERLAKTAFEQADKRRKKLALVLKTSVLGDIGEFWDETFQEISKDYPGVEYSLRPSGAGFSDMYLFPYDTIVTDDQGGDIIADVVPTFLYKTRNMVPAVNIGKDLCVYQTDHGSDRYSAGKDLMNPIGMITALSMALDYSFGMPGESDKIKSAVNKTLSQGYRTQDMYQESNNLVGEREMTERIIEQI